MMGVLYSLPCQTLLPNLRRRESLVKAYYMLLWFIVCILNHNAGLHNAVVLLHEKINLTVY